MSKKNELITERGADFIGQLVFKDEISNEPKNMIDSVVTIKIYDSIDSFLFETQRNQEHQNIFDFHVDSAITERWNSNLYTFEIIEETNGIKTIDRTKLWVE